MGTWARRILITFGVLIALLGAAGYWLLFDGSAPKDGAFAFDITAMRTLASSGEGEKPAEVRFETVAKGAFPFMIAVPGDQWNTLPIAVLSFQVTYPSGAPVIIDATLDKAGADTMGADFDAAAYDRVKAAMASARAVAVTHEHVDHMGGLAAWAKTPEQMQNVRLTKEQVESKAFTASKMDTNALAGYQPLEYEGLHLIAPGVVAIKAPGHTPGSQMFFVQLADGREYLFLGDVAWMMRNVDLLRERSRLATMIIGEDRAKVMRQLEAIAELMSKEPALNVMPGHDTKVLDALVTKGALTAGFK